MIRQSGKGHPLPKIHPSFSATAGARSSAVLWPSASTIAMAMTASPAINKSPAVKFGRVLHPAHRIGAGEAREVADRVDHRNAGGGAAEQDRGRQGPEYRQGAEQCRKRRS